jgi:hypothetical protein
MNGSDDGVLDRESEAPVRNLDAVELGASKNAEQVYKHIKNLALPQERATRKYRMIHGRALAYLTHGPKTWLLRSQIRF